MLTKVKYWRSYSKAIYLLLILTGLIHGQGKVFLEKQKEFPKVKEAYSEKISSIIHRLSELNISLNELNILIVAYKREKELEIWVKRKYNKEFQKLIEYNICSISGELGPKRKEWDAQIPEGFYHIVSFNPTSFFHLSFSINYPNKSDKILSPFSELGNDICIHGGCTTIGCLPMTNDIIQEIYIYAIESKANGQRKIPIYIFPTRMDDFNYSELLKEYGKRNELLAFWQNLKEGYNKFDSSKVELKLNINNRGKYIFE